MLTTIADMPSDVAMSVLIVAVRQMLSACDTWPDAAYRREALQRLSECPATKLHIVIERIANDHPGAVPPLDAISAAVRQAHSEGA